MQNHHTRRGFTLIELSVVLVIIGFIVAALIVAQSMKRSAGVQALITDEAHYVEAARQFKEKYGFLPGDFPNATTYWGTDTTCPNNAGNITPQSTTCNGDGDGKIESAGTGAGNSNSYEAYRAWQQLADAGLLEGSFTGSAGPLSTSSCEQSVPGVNVPATRLQGGGMEWIMFNASGSMTTSFLNPINYQQYILIGENAGGCNLMAPFLTSAEAYSLDVKVDDGLPGTGIITSVTNTFNSQCIATTTQGPIYVTGTTTTPQCIMLFQVNF
jgi:prepilin-type N-terminal cleavage/methylation domain-containing protein